MVKLVAKKMIKVWLSMAFLMSACPADVGRNVILTSGCIIGAFCQVNTCEVIPENTVIYGSGCMRRVQTERPQVSKMFFYCFIDFSTSVAVGCYFVMISGHIHTPETQNLSKHLCARMHWCINVYTSCRSVLDQEPRSHFQSERTNQLIMGTA